MRGFFKVLTPSAGLLIQVFYATGTVLEKRAVAFFNPAAGGGSMLSNGTSLLMLSLTPSFTFFLAGSGGGEPLNVSFSTFLV
jgi:hypothetical protein